MPEILFIAAHRPGRSPSQRFRFEQYIDFLGENGYKTHISYLIEEGDDKAFYSPGNVMLKSRVVFESFRKRLADLKRAHEMDIVFVQREAFMTGTTFFERRFARSRAKLVFDFDDAIWLDNVSDANKKFNWLKNPSKTATILGVSDLSIAGNAHLAKYARKYTDRVTVIPTTIDTHEYKPSGDRKKDQSSVTIGWSGSITTIQHFEFAVPFLRILKEKYKDRINIQVIGDANYRNTELDITGLPWKKNSEIEDLQTMHIGIMPLPNDEWVKGKCGLKGLQYMALEIPTIMSPVGVNTEIIEHGRNGFLAGNLEEWVKYLDMLIESAELRARLGKEGRRTVEERYSVESQKDKYLSTFNELLSR